jgi:hypothetical protein
VVLPVVPARKEAGAETVHQTGHVLVDRIAVAINASEDRMEPKP